MKTAAQYIMTVYGQRTFARALELNDAESIMDLMNDFASVYANQKLDEAAEKGKAYIYSEQGFGSYAEIDKQSILQFKDKLQ